MLELLTVIHVSTDLCTFLFRAKEPGIRNFSKYLLVKTAWHPKKPEFLSAPLCEIFRMR